MICNHCKLDKDSSNFHKRAKAPSGFAPRCKACCKQRDADYFLSNKEKRLQQGRTRANNMRAESRRMKAERGCALCPEREAVCLDWHHLDPHEKEWEPADVASRSWTAFMKEIAKCVVLCSNCHRKVHAGIFRVC